MICSSKYTVHYYAPPNADPSKADILCSDGRFVTYQLLHVDKHYQEHLRRLHTANFKNVDANYDCYRQWSKVKFGEFVFM